LIFGSELAEELNGFDDREQAKQLLDGFSSYSEEEERKEVK